jgi:ABC-type transport system involved in multi-copper enzyme maturation permease subunit
MKGLMIKDFCLLGNQKKILPVYLLLMVWFTAMHSDGFAFPFLTMMASILTVGTISYDEIDHSQGYLFTLPVERRTYVQEKFILGWIVVAASLALASACSLVRALVSDGMSFGELGTTALLSAIAGAAMLAVMIPIRIRFTGDQGRIVLFAAFGVVALAGILLTKVLPGVQAQVTEALAGMGMPAVLLLAAAAACVLTVAGWLLGIRFMKKKEF